MNIPAPTIIHQSQFLLVQGWQNRYSVQGRKSIDYLKTTSLGVPMFETDQDALAWYERQPRALSEPFLKSIPWSETPRYQLNSEFIPILFYMRDVESFTDIYHRELMRTPTGKDPIIRKFMDRWVVEEAQHATLLNRFLEEAGIPTGPRWEAEARAKIPTRYRVESLIIDYAVKPLGAYFHGAHMVWGAINEMTTLQAYRRLSQMAGHPVLTMLLRAIMQVETIHTRFYWNIARLKLDASRFSRGLARFIVGKFWAPVGQGAKPKREVDYLIATLFKGASGVSFFERNVNRRLQELPGFANFKPVTDRIARIAL
jgi:hypothetical protein